MSAQRKVILYIAMSLDGYIAKEDDNIDFLSMVEIPGEDYGYHDFLQRVDTVIWGRKTYEKVLSMGIDFPHKSRKVYVASRQRQGKDDYVSYIRDVPTLIKALQSTEGKDIYCDGGSEIVYELLKHDMIDQLIISVIPHLLGSGKSLFRNGLGEKKLQWSKTISYPSGLVQLWYDIKR